MKTTLNKIRKHGPCSEGWTRLLSHLGKTQADDEPLSLVTILNSNGLDDAIWCLRTVEGYDRQIRLYAVACARDVQHLMTDERSITVLDVAERYTNGDATEYELMTAWNAADVARDAASVAADVARTAAYAARTAAYAARTAAWVAAIAARDAAGEAARTEWRGRGPTARTVAMSAYDDIQAKQEQRFREMVAEAQGQS